MGGAEKLVNLLAEIHQLQVAAGVSSGNVETHQSAEAATVHARELAQVEDDALVVRDELFDLDGENFRHAGHQPSVAFHHDSVTHSLLVQRQSRSSCVLRHALLPRSSELSRGMQVRAIFAHSYRDAMSFLGAAAVTSCSVRAG